MQDNERSYIAIDLKSFYASVECMERGLNPLTTNLVVADMSRTTKTICLAVSPSLKSWGIPGRPRLFEVVRKVKQVNDDRRRMAPGQTFSKSSVDGEEIRRDPTVELDYLVAPPRMAKYMEVSRQIYRIYLRYIAPEDIHVYSIDEVFIDATDYLRALKMTSRELAETMMRDILRETGITATAGLGTNLYLAKIAMDIEAKHIEPDENGARIAELDEMSYRRKLWDHRPLTDFWRIGKGYAEKLESAGLFTMGDIARCSLGAPSDYYNEELLYRMFGIYAELLIDHAWGYEPCRISHIKSYKPESSSISHSQVLSTPYDFEKAMLVAKEMADALALELVDKKLTTDQLVLTVGYDIENLTDPVIKRKYKGSLTTDRYGRKVPKQAHGSGNLTVPTSSASKLMEKTVELFHELVNEDLLIRRLTLSAQHLSEEGTLAKKTEYEQLDLFTDYGAGEEAREQEEENLQKERKMQETMLSIKKKYGKNAILKGMNLEEGATAKERNSRIGGHKA